MWCLGLRGECTELDNSQRRFIQLLCKINHRCMTATTVLDYALLTLCIIHAKSVGLVISASMSHWRLQTMSFRELHKSMAKYRNYGFLGSQNADLRETYEDRGLGRL